uniref:Uncharacterized protein n=1 Tax=Anopheles christyi TaxID=43041 RepID=A0A182KID0_9DIPT
MAANGGGGGFCHWSVFLRLSVERVRLELIAVRRRQLAIVGTVFHLDRDATLKWRVTLDLRYLFLLLATTGVGRLVDQ